MELELVNFKQAETLKEFGFPQHNDNYCYINSKPRRKQLRVPKWKG